MTQSWDITDDSDLRDAVRGETGYDRDTLDKPNLDAVIQSAKRELALRADVTSFYSDRGLAVALHGLACVKAKGRVENSPVRVKNLGAHDVTFRTSEGDSLQVGQYEDMVQTGLAQSDEVDDAVPNIELTRTWLNDNRSA